MGEQNLLGQRMGNYQLVRMLGRGGFADVYLGEHLHLGTRAAIKVLLTTLVGAAEIEQFRAEARMVAHLIHPHIVEVLEFGIEGNIPFLVMRYADGGTLRQRYPKGSRIAIPTIVTYLRQVASALQYAHNERVIHRDVKPENMLIGSNQEILLSDFGVALVAQSTRRSMQAIAGTATYMAPEQFQGKACAASDQYGLAVVVYEWACGEPPFRGSFSEIAGQHLTTPPPMPHTRQPDISALIEQVLVRALAKDPALRFGSVQEFADAFEQASSPYYEDLPTLPAYQSPQAMLAAAENNALYSVAGQPALDPQPAVMKKEALPASKRPRKRGLSRRGLLTGCLFTGLAGAGIAASSQYWLLYLRLSHLNLPTVSIPVLNINLTSSPTPGPIPTPDPTPSPTPSPTPEPTPTPAALGTTLYIYPGHHNNVEAATWSPDGKRIASASDDKTVQVWNASDGGNVLIYTGHTDIVAGVSWSPDGSRIASSSNDKTVQVWNASDGGNVLVYKGHTDVVAGVAWSPDGNRIASAGGDTTVQIWSAATGARSMKLTGHKGKVWWVAWSSDGKRIASASSDMTVKVWDAATGSNTFTYHGHTGHVYAAAWSADDRRIASCSGDKTVQVWDAEDGGHPFTYHGHHDTVWSLGWSPDGKRIGSVSNDRTAQLWDASDGGHPFIYTGQNAISYFLTWSPDGTRIVTGGTDMSVEVWQAI